MARKRKFKNDYTPVCDAELDLHGHTSFEARTVVMNFLKDAEINDWHLIRIVVGNGLHSRDSEAVLPDVIKTLLNTHGYTYRYAKIQDGGEGALEVSL